jgi:sugar phosphate isomerase/epimerase
MDRRAFLERGAALASAAMWLPRVQPRQRYKMGLQLFTVRAPLAADLTGTLRRIAELGYQEVETYGFDADGLAYYKLPARAFAGRLGDHGLTAPSGHYDLNRFATASADDLNRYVDACITGAKAIGQSYITWPYLDPPSRLLEAFKAVVDRLNLVGKRVAEAGLSFAYHNHGYEFVEQDGQVPYDILLNGTDPALVKLEVDLYWLAHDSKQPARYWFDKAPGRFVMWHVKDMHKVSHDYTELGNGSIDYTTIWPDAERSGMKHFFVEQGGNFTRDPMQSIADGAAYVKTFLLKTVGPR